MKKITIIGHLTAKIGRVILNNAAVKSLQSKRQNKESELLARTEKWISAKGWQEDLSMSGVAAKLGTDTDNLSVLFRERFGIRFLEWRRKVRIEEAKRLLLEDKTIPTAVIGEAVGIPDRSNFRRQFKMVTGYTPAEWRRLKH